MPRRVPQLIDPFQHHLKLKPVNKHLWPFLELLYHGFLAFDADDTPTASIAFEALAAAFHVAKLTELAGVVRTLTHLQSLVEEVLAILRGYAME
jgi:hypothetical protein